jgi:cytosine/adenosine deaminase-related metal-dependent hydrolase
VLVTVADGRFSSVVVDAPPAGAVRLSGLVLPGLANCHSHAFHRALRGRTQTGTGTFWTWREQMYEVAARLTPDTYYQLARAVYGEMVLGGVAAVGEFHYLHHAPGGRRYDEPNVMGEALIAAARDAGLRITLLDTCYLAGGIDEPLSEAQRRFSDGDVTRWAVRVAGLRGADDVVIGAAAHSVRAVPADQLGAVALALPDAPLHVHLSEQVAENTATLAAYGRTPAQLLDEAGFLGPLTSAVHATHLTAVDVGLLGTSGTYSCLCPTTERDLAGRDRPVRGAAHRGLAGDAGVRQPRGDRPVRGDARRRAGRTPRHSGARPLVRRGAPAPPPPRTVTARWASPTRAGSSPAPAPTSVAVRLDSVRTAGGGATVEVAVFAATAADVTDVVVSGNHLVAGGQHKLLDVAAELAAAVGAVTSGTVREVG